MNLGCGIREDNLLVRHHRLHGLEREIHTCLLRIFGPSVELRLANWLARINPESSWSNDEFHLGLGWIGLGVGGQGDRHKY